MQLATHFWGTAWLVAVMSSTATADPHSKRTLTHRDTCLSLSRECNVSIQELIEANDGDSSWCSSLRPGQKISCSQGYPSHSFQDTTCVVYTVQTGDTCGSIGRSFNITGQTISKFNHETTWAWTGCDNLVAGTKICLSSGKPPPPNPIKDAVCGPQAPGAHFGNHIKSVSDLALINPCPLNACCGVNGQCGNSAEFCTRRNPSDFSHCISNCGTNIETSNNIVEEYLRIVQYDPTQKLDAFLSDNPGYTHIHWSKASISKNMTIRVDNKHKQWEEFILLQNSKKILSLGDIHESAGESSNSNDKLREAMQPQTRWQFVSQLVKFVDTSGINGVHFDWQISQSSSSDVRLYLDTLRELRRQLSDKYSISISLPAQYSLLKAYPARELATLVDYFVYLTYDLFEHSGLESGVSQSGCPAGNCLRSHINQTEVEYALSMITKAGVSSQQVVVGEASYGRAFTMVDPRCYGSDCLFKVDPSSPQVPASTCSNGSRTLLDSQIAEILDQRHNRAVTWHDKKSASDLLIFDDTYWVSYASEKTRKARAAYWRKLGFLGTAEFQTRCKSEIPTIGQDTHTTPDPPAALYPIPSHGLSKPSGGDEQSPQAKPEAPTISGSEEPQRPYQDLPINVPQVSNNDDPWSSSVVDRPSGRYTQTGHIGFPTEQVTSVFTVYVTTVAGRTETVTRCIVETAASPSGVVSRVDSYPAYMPPAGHGEYDNPSEAHQPTSGEITWRDNYSLDIPTLIRSETEDTRQTDSDFRPPFPTFHTSRFWNTSTVSTTEMGAEPPFSSISDIRLTTDVPTTPHLPALTPHDTSTSTYHEPTSVEGITISPTAVGSVTTSNPWNFTQPNWQASTSVRSELETTLSTGVSEAFGTGTGSTQSAASPGIPSGSTGITAPTSQTDPITIGQTTSPLEPGTGIDTTSDTESTVRSIGASSEVLSGTRTDENPTVSTQEAIGTHHTVSGSPNGEAGITSETGSLVTQAPITDDQSHTTGSVSVSDGNSSSGPTISVASEDISMTTGAFTSLGLGATNAAPGTHTTGEISEGLGENETSVHSEDVDNGSATSTDSQQSVIQTSPRPTTSGSISADLPNDGTRTSSDLPNASTIPSDVTLNPHESSTDNELSTIQSSHETISGDTRTNEVTKTSESNADSTPVGVDTRTNTPASDQTSAFSDGTGLGTEPTTKSSLSSIGEVHGSTDAISDMPVSTNDATESNGDREKSTDAGLGLTLPSLPTIDLTSLPGTLLPIQTDESTVLESITKGPTIESSTTDDGFGAIPVPTFSDDPAEETSTPSDCQGGECTIGKDCKDPSCTRGGDCFGPNCTKAGACVGPKCTRGGQCRGDKCESGGGCEGVGCVVGGGCFGINCILGGTCVGPSCHQGGPCSQKTLGDCPPGKCTGKQCDEEGDEDCTSKTTAEVCTETVSSTVVTTIPTTSWSTTTMTSCRTLTECDITDSTTTTTMTGTEEPDPQATPEGFYDYDEEENTPTSFWDEVEDDYDEWLREADRIPTTTTTSQPPTTFATSTKPRSTVTVTAQPDPTPEARCIQMGAGVSWKFVIVRILNWADDGGAKLKKEESGCGGITEWEWQSGDNSNLGHEVSFNLPLFMKSGCVERAIVSAGGPSIKCKWHPGGVGPDPDFFAAKGNQTRPLPTFGDVLPTEVHDERPKSLPT
ncbi:hypothetical protein FPOAC2_13044 [Fusarium poae]|uniref:hypothetical protein n=1 Tax=Fusarium poae TaxID=36050 RepID=UPI001CE99414|nr:hypothetical protein FPOAC1_012681 [Fusarium poae]KAG8667842.1 hypothetical protein FPOAC1_012681 [Fusarium poae]